MKRQIFTLALLALLLLAGALGMFLGNGDISLSERRPLAQWPTLTGAKILNGSFMQEAEKAAADQFAMRDSFRAMKADFLYHFLAKLDNNDLFSSQGHICKLEYPLREGSVEKAADRFLAIYEAYLKEGGSKCYYSVIPEKNRYLDSAVYPRIDYDRMAEIVGRHGFMEYINIFPLLDLDMYYTSDPHWRQEAIGPVAQALLDAMEAPSVEGLTEESAGTFLGSYAGQYALPVKEENLHYMAGGWLDDCTARDLITGEEIPIYNLAGARGQDPYDLFLGGASALQVLENPNAATDRELILFRDSFGSSMAPLLASAYRSVTLVDLRYISSAQLGAYLDFHGQDVLFLYSTLVLNRGETLK